MFIFIYLFFLAVPGLSCCMWKLRLSLWHVGSLVAVRKLLVVAHGDLVP